MDTTFTKTIMMLIPTSIAGHVSCPTPIKAIHTIDGTPVGADLSALVLPSQYINRPPQSIINSNGG